jgi:uncharacterized protein (TIGR02246 family)
MTHNDLSSAASIVDALVEAYNAHDAHAFAALFTEDAVAYEHPGTPAQIGRSNIQAYYEKRFAELPDLRTEVLHRIIVGEYIIDHERVVREKGQPPFETVAINLVRDGVIHRLDIVR